MVIGLPLADQSALADQSGDACAGSDPRKAGMVLTLLAFCDLGVYSQSQQWRGFLQNRTDGSAMENEPDRAKRFSKKRISVKTTAARTNPSGVIAPSSYARPY